MSNRIALLTSILMIGGMFLTGCDREFNRSIGNMFSDGEGGGLFGQTPKQAAADLFNPYDADRRRRALNLFSVAPFGGAEAYVKAYRNFLNDPDPTVRAAALRALGNHGIPGDVPTITVFLKEKNQYIRYEAVVALQRLHHKEAVDPLLDTLSDDEEADVRANAALALAQYPTENVYRSLVSALDDRDFFVVSSSIQSLKNLTGQSFGDDIPKWLEYQKSSRQLFASKEPYYYQRFVRPPTWLDHATFWSKVPEKPAPQKPKGIEATATNLSESNSN